MCIATPDIVGPVRTGGIGTAYASLAEALAGAGHKVTILYAQGQHCEVGTIADWTAYYRARGVQFEPLPLSPVRMEAVHQLKIAHDVYLWLKSRSFDVIHFPEMFGCGCFALEAKRLGLAFDASVLCVGLHSPTVWHLIENGECVDRVEQLTLDAMERKSVALADVVVSPSNYLLEWVRSWGWELPEHVHVHPYVSPEVPVNHAARGAVGEIVFFGRLETRKGLELFCDAVERLYTHGVLADRKVVFLGKIGLAGGKDALEYLRERTQAWPYRWDVITELGRQDAIAYLESHDVLAVMPSVSDNAPNTVLECLGRGIPFVATAVGGIPEMIDGADHERVLAPPEAAGIADRIRQVLREGAVPAAPAYEPRDVRRAWVAWHEAQVIPPPTPRPALPQRPLVSVCLATRNRGAVLQQAIASIEQQTYRPLEIVLVDDGSDSPEAVRYLDEVAPNFVKEGWTLVRGPQRFPGAARNTAAAHARGKFLLFMDDDNVALPHEIQTLVTAAEYGGLPLLTCGFDAFSGDRPPAQANGFEFRWVPLGASMPLGMIVNCFGDTNMLVRRDKFFEIGGFDEECGAGLVEDWVFHSRAYLAGIDPVAVPEVLFHYRVWPDGSGQTAPRHLSYLRAARPYMEAMAPGFALLPLYAAGLFRRFEWRTGAVPEDFLGLQAEYARTLAEVRAFRTSLSWRATAPFRRIYDLLAALIRPTR